MEPQGVQVIEANEDLIPVVRTGNTVISISINSFRMKHDKGFIILSNDNKPQVISDFDNMVVNENTIVDIASIHLGLDFYDDLVFAF